MAQDYDKIIKENLREVVETLIAKVLGIKAKRKIQLDSKIQITDEREADFIYTIISTEGEKFILHLEFQTTNDSNMIYRMLRYFVYIMEKYKLPIQQYLIYRER